MFCVNPGRAGKASAGGHQPSCGNQKLGGGGSFGSPGTGCVTIILPSICLCFLSIVPLSFAIFLLSLLLNSKPWEDAGCSCLVPRGEHSVCTG